jgi:hypothetical protein
LGDTITDFVRLLVASTDLPSSRLALIELLGAVAGDHGIEGVEDVEGVKGVELLRSHVEHHLRVYVHRYGH